uniref:NADPH-dependent FMN reductase n=1 Tax=Ningiella ruwaisensis TaxID=2364274 RepID=UPI00109F0C9A|nr:NAD(P)H-dependent oxidoreductase [Ningiella ruwaisensis]
MKKILAFAGSGRKHSYNFAAVKVAAEGAREAGADVTVIDMSEYADIPIFTEDLEAQQGMPEKAKALKELLKSHDAFLISSPEYNSGYSALFKNVIDWASRKEEGEKPLEAFKGKYAALLAASPGGLGGIRVLVPVRLLLSNIGVNVLGDQLAISNVGDLVDENHEMSDEATMKKLHKLGQQLVDFTKA